MTKINNDRVVSDAEKQAIVNIIEQKDVRDHFVEAEKQAIVNIIEQKDVRDHFVEQEIRKFSLRYPNADLQMISHYFFAVGLEIGLLGLTFQLEQETKNAADVRG